MGVPQANIALYSEGIKNQNLFKTIRKEDFPFIFLVALGEGRAG